MCAVLLLMMITFTFFLVSSNWDVGVTFLGTSPAIVAARVEKEEAMMAREFGN
jgi:protein-S-isoprenylcysteine O-methyltransferase Ste14